MRCCNCNLPLRPDNMVEAVDMNGELIYLCRYCHRHTHGCRACGRTFDIRCAIFMRISGSHNYQGILCPDCYHSRQYYTCRECGVEFIMGPYELRGLLYCRKCYNRNVVFCARCYCSLHRDYAHYFNGRPYCGICRNYANCRPVRRGASDIIRPYYYKPQPKFWGEGSVFYGVEIETDNYRRREASARVVHELDKAEENFYIKNDASLVNGFEIVFHPRSLQSWVEYNLEKVLEVVEENGGQAADTCGLHIHRSRGDLSEVTIAKILAFFSFCKDQIVALSGRESRYAHFGQLDKDTFGHYKNRLQYCNDRYQAVNLQPEHTIEFRTFKGTLSGNLVKIYIIFVDFVIQFVKSILVVELSPYIWEYFVDFLKVMAVKDKNAETLLSYLISIELI